MKEQLIPDVAKDKIRACVAREDTDKFATCKEISDQWIAYGPGIIDRKMKSEGWKPVEARGRAHRWFLASQASEAGLGYQSMLNRQRVGDAWIARGYLGGENENISYQKIVCLMVNAEKGADGLIKTSILDERLEWFHKVTDDNSGQPPSVLDIQNEFRKNGEKTEDEIIWAVVVRNCKKYLKLENTDISKYKLAREIVEVEPNLSSVAVDCSGGSE